MVLTLWCILMVACTQDTSLVEEQGSEGPRKVKITTTVNMVSDLVRQIGGENIEVVEIMGPGVDTHLYKASANDVNKLQKADAILHVRL